MSKQPNIILETYYVAIKAVRITKENLHYLMPLDSDGVLDTSFDYGDWFVLRDNGSEIMSKNTKLIPKSKVRDN